MAPFIPCGGNGGIPGGGPPIGTPLGGKGGAKGGGPPKLAPLGGGKGGKPGISIDVRLYMPWFLFFPIKAIVYSSIIANSWRRLCIPS